VSAHPVVPSLRRPDRPGRAGRLGHVLVPHRL